MPTHLAVFIPNSQSHKIIGCFGQHLWCHFLNCSHTWLSVLSCLSPSLGCGSPPRVPREPLLDKTHYPSLLLFRKLIIPSISWLSHNRMNMASHHLIRSLCLEFAGEHNSGRCHCISCNYLSNVTSIVWHLILLLVIDSRFGVYTLTPSDSNIAVLLGRLRARWIWLSGPFQAHTVNFCTGWKPSGMKWGLNRSLFLLFFLQKISRLALCWQDQ